MSFKVPSLLWIILPCIAMPWPSITASSRPTALKASRPLTDTAKSMLWPREYSTLMSKWWQANFNLYISIIFLKNKKKEKKMANTRYLFIVKVNTRMEEYEGILVLRSHFYHSNWTLNNKNTKAIQIQKASLKHRNCGKYMFRIQSY